jgi:uncharacterized membrane protein YsdA (DUF1294 family)
MATLLATTVLLIGGGVVAIMATSLRRHRHRHWAARKIALHGVEVELALEMTVNHLDQLGDDDCDDDDEYTALPRIV